MDLREAQDFGLMNVGPLPYVRALLGKPHRQYARKKCPSMPSPVPFWLPQSLQRNRTLPMNRLAKVLCASGALLFHTNGWAPNGAGHHILG